MVGQVYIIATFKYLHDQHRCTTVLPGTSVASHWYTFIVLLGHYSTGTFIYALADFVCFDYLYIEELRRESCQICKNCQNNGHDKENVICRNFYDSRSILINKTVLKSS